MLYSTDEYPFALPPGSLSYAACPNKLFFSAAILLQPHALSFAATPIISKALVPYLF